MYLQLERLGVSASPEGVSNSPHPARGGNVFEGPQRKTNLWEQHSQNPSRALLRGTHDTHNEALDIRKQLVKGLSLDRAHEYPRAQARSFLKEFAGGAGNTVTYAVRDGKLFAPGNAVPTSEALRLYAHSAQEGSREWADAEGFKKIEQLLMSANEGQLVFQLSPPSVQEDGKFKEGFGDYGFLNVFERRGETVTATHIPYFQESSILRLTKGVAEKLGIGTHTIEEGEQDPATFYISNPILKTSTNKAELLGTLGLWGEWKKLMADERFFHETILKDPYISTWLQSYEGLQVGAATTYTNTQELTLEAEELLIAAYNRAKTLYEGRRQTLARNMAQEYVVAPTEALAYYANMVMQIQPGSCPAGLALQTSLSRQGYVAYGALSEHLIQVPLGEWKKRDCVTCPMEGCGKVSTKAEPHLFNGKEWICANPGCVAHNPKIYKLVTNPDGMYTV